EHREGADPSTGHKWPGRNKFEAISLERGVTHDPEFEKWAQKVWNLGSGLGAEVSLKDFRKDIIIELYNEAGQLAIAYNVFRCWVSEYQALPELDANANAVAIEMMKLENEGWERDLAVVEPSEPTLLVCDMIALADEELLSLLASARTVPALMLLVSMLEMLVSYAYAMRLQFGTYNRHL